MKLRAAVIFLGLLVVAVRSDAGWLRLGRQSALPEPSNSVKALTKQDESHKVGKRAQHPAKYLRPEWGSIWKQSLGTLEAHYGHFLFER